MSATETIQFSIYRFQPEAIDAKTGESVAPHMQTFSLTIPQGSDMMILEALVKLKQEDETLTLRRSCREGVCGSDGMNINGKNRLACITPVKSLKQPIVIRPLPGFPVIKDLVVDMDQFYRQYEKVKPWLQNHNSPPGRERIQTPEERARLDGLYECILCACCSSSCPSYWWNPDKFIGPAGLLQANRFIQDSRDTATSERLKQLGDPYSLFRCRGIMNCADVCPKGLNPTHAIGEIREKMLNDEV